MAIAVQPPWDDPEDDDPFSSKLAAIGFVIVAVLFAAFLVWRVATLLL